MLQQAGETTVSRLALRSCPALRRQRATDLTVGGLAAARGGGRAGARLWAMKSVVLRISYYRLFALWPTTDAREYFEGIVIDLTIEQLYNNTTAARDASRGASPHHRPLELALGVVAAARASQARGRST